MDRRQAGIYTLRFRRSVEILTCPLDIKPLYVAGAGFCQPFDPGLLLLFKDLNSICKIFIFSIASSGIRLFSPIGRDLLGEDFARMTSISNIISACRFFNIRKGSIFSNRGMKILFGTINWCLGDRFSSMDGYFLVVNPIHFAIVLKGSSVAHTKREARCKSWSYSPFLVLLLAFQTTIAVYHSSEVCQLCLC